ncbi:hypothetical protein ABZP36_012715 [Zizania latifolia]
MAALCVGRRATVSVSYSASRPTGARERGSEMVKMARRERKGGGGGNGNSEGDTGTAILLVPAPTKQKLIKRRRERERRGSMRWKRGQRQRDGWRGSQRRPATRSPRPHARPRSTPLHSSPSPSPSHRIESHARPPLPLRYPARLLSYIIICPAGLAAACRSLLRK